MFPVKHAGRATEHVPNREWGRGRSTIFARHSPWSNSEAAALLSVTRKEPVPNCPALPVGQPALPEVVRTVVDHVAPLA